MAKIFVAALAFLISTGATSHAQPDAKDRQITSKSFPVIKLVRIPAKGKQFTMGAPKGEPGQGLPATEQ